MEEFIDTPQKAAPAILTIFDAGMDVFRAASLGDFGASNTGIYNSITFSSLPSPQKAAPAVMYLYDSISGNFRAATPADLSGGSVGGLVNLSSGQSFVEVSGLSLSYSPSWYGTQVIKPSSQNTNLFATVRGNSITSTGFIADLSATVNTTGYKLGYKAYA